MEIKNLLMKPNKDAVKIQLLDEHKPFNLFKKYKSVCKGVYDSSVILTDWKADMVIRVSCEELNLKDAEVYAHHRDFSFC